MNEMTKTAPAKTPAARAPASPMGWLRNEIDRLFDDFGGSPRSLFDFGLRTPAFTPTPPLEFTDGEKEYRLTAELPGLTEKDVTIDVTDGVLTISGEKKDEEEKTSNGYILSERRYGSFARQIAVPADVDPNGISAKFDKGVLTVTLAKDSKAAPRSRKIAIDA